MPLDRNQIEQAQGIADQRKKGRVEEAIGYANRTEPQMQREVDQLSRQTQVPFDTVKSNIAEARHLANLKDVDVPSLMQQSPQTAQWMSDPVRASISRDDIEVMQKLEQRIATGNRGYWNNSLRNVGERVNTITGMIARAGAMSIEGYEEVAQLAGLLDEGDHSLSEKVDHIGKAISEGGLGYRADFTPERWKDDPTLKNYIGMLGEQGPAAMADMAYMMASTPFYLLGRSREIAEEIADNEGREAQAIDVIRAAPTALLVTAIDKYSAKGMLGMLADNVVGTGVKYGVKEITKSVVREAGTEFMQEQIEYAGSVIGTDVGWDLGESLWRGSVGAMIGGPMGATVRGATLPVDALRLRVQKDFETNIKSLGEQQDIDSMIDSISNMKLFQESPERAGEFLRGLEGDSKLYVTPEEVIAAAGEGLPVSPEMLRQAEEGNEVEVTVDRFATEVMTNDELLTRLRPHLKRSADALTQEEIQNRDNSRLDKILTNARKETEILEEADAIHKDITDQLVATGRMSEETARYSAALIPAYVTTKTAELRAMGKNVTVEEVYGMMNFRIEKEKPRVRATAEGVLPPEVAASPPVTPDTPTEATIPEDGDLVPQAENPRIDMHFKQVTQRVPQLTEAAKLVKEGEMTREEYARLVNEYKPVSPYEAPPVPNTGTEISNALAKNKRDRVGQPMKTLEEGHNVGIRLDIPAYSNHGVWAVSVHEFGSGFKAGKSIGYESVAHVTNATLGAHEGLSLQIAGGKAKSTIAVVKGNWKATSLDDANALAEEALSDPDWVQVGYDPERHSYFYNRATMEPVVAGEEVLQVGPLTLVKKPTYGDPDNFLFQEDMGDLQEIQAELSAFEKLLACTRAG